MKKLGFPKGIYVELTNRCNLSCPMCRIGSVKGQVLDIQVYRDIAATLFPHADFVDLRGWGESTILKNFESYLEIASSYPIKKKIVTNGTSPKKRTWELLAQHEVMTAFSVDAISPDLFRILRGGGEIDQVISNVDHLVSEFQKGGKSSQEFVYFIIVMSPDNLVEIPKIINTGHRLGINRFKIEPITLESEDDSSHLIHFRDQVLTCVDELSELAARNTNLSIELNAAPLPELSHLNKTSKLCLHPFDYIYINAAGRIGFCDHLNGMDQYTYGKWSEGFHKVWNGEKMEKLRAEHHKKAIDGSQISTCHECNWCYENRFSDLEELVDPSWQEYIVKL